MGEHGVGEARGDHEPIAETVGGPGDDLTGRGRFELDVATVEFVAGQEMAAVGRGEVQFGGAHVAHSDSATSATYGPVSSKST